MIWRSPAFIIDFQTIETSAPGENDCFREWTLTFYPAEVKPPLQTPCSPGSPFLNPRGGNPNIKSNDEMYILYPSTRPWHRCQTIEIKFWLKYTKEKKNQKKKVFILTMQAYFCFNWHIFCHMWVCHSWHMLKNMGNIKIISDGITLRRNIYMHEAL